MKPSEFTVRERDLATALEISPEQLDKIIAFFDSDLDDEWELRENDHFIYTNQKWKERLFSQHGAFTVAKYMDSKGEKTIWSQIVEFITRHKEKIRNAFVRQKVQENCSSLTRRNSRHFLSKKDVVSILCTSHARFNKAFEEVKRSSTPLIVDEDYCDIEGVPCYSLSALDKLSRNLSTQLKDRDRQAWCSAVEVVGSKTLKLLIDEEESRERRIEVAKSAAKRRDKECCQITGRKSTKHDRVNIAAHHLYCDKHYPHLATSLDNLITLTEPVHQEFHSWNGGFGKACTIDDLIRFVNEQYPDNDRVSILLNQRKRVLS